MRQFGIEPSSPANVEYSNYLADYTVDPDPHTPLNTKIGVAVSSLWQDSSIETLLERQSEFYLMDSAP